MNNLSNKELLSLINKVKSKLKKDKVMQETFNEYSLDINEIDLIPMMFKDLPVSARTEKAVIYFNNKILSEPNPEETLLPYALHETVHWCQQTTGTKPTKSSDKKNYLFNPNEEEAFQKQVKHIAKNSGEKEADEYVDQVLDKHELKGKKREERKDVLLSEAGAHKDILIDLEEAGLPANDKQLAIFERVVHDELLKYTDDVISLQSKIDFTKKEVLIKASINNVDNKEFDKLKGLNNYKNKAIPKFKKGFWEIVNKLSTAFNIKKNFKENDDQTYFILAISPK